MTTRLKELMKRGGEKERERKRGREKEWEGERKTG
jgi:hypothetical protein